MIPESCAQAIGIEPPGRVEGAHATRMSRRSSRARNARRNTSAEPAVSRLRGPGDVAVMVPYLLGFRPVDSLVLVALEGSRKRFGPVLRVDLVKDVELLDQQSRLVTDVMAENRVTLVILAAFTASPELADPLVGRVREALAERGIGLEDAFRADGGRWWSYVCDNPRCCSPNGVPYQAGASRVAAEAVVAGLAFEPDRDALRSGLAPADADARASVAAAVARLRAGEPARVPAPAEVEAAIIRALSARADLTPEEIASLALAVQTTPGLDRAARLVTRAGARQHYELWRRVTTVVDDELLPAVGWLAGLAAWLDGRGVLASHAVDRVLAVAPHHGLSRMLANVLAHGVNPSLWESAGWPES
jgi:uncharacterized protein DUF4192